MKTLKSVLIRENHKNLILVFIKFLNVGVKDEK